MHSRFRGLATVAALVGLLGAVEVSAQSSSKPAAPPPAGQAARNPEPIKDTNNDRTKQRASDRARQVDGVRRVVNNLKVQG